MPQRSGSHHQQTEKDERQWRPAAGVPVCPKSTAQKEGANAPKHKQPPKSGFNSAGQPESPDHSCFANHNDGACPPTATLDHLLPTTRLAAYF
jgi:hypothetical protein